MSTVKHPSKLHSAAWMLLCLLLINSAPGCSHAPYSCIDGLDQRVLPPGDLDSQEQLSSTHKTPQDISNPKNESRPNSSDEATAKKDAAPASATQVNVPPGQTLTLAQAIDTAFRLQPRLRVYMESVEQDRRVEDMAFAVFLPTAGVAYTVGGFPVAAAAARLPGVGRASSARGGHRFRSVLANGGGGVFGRRLRPERRRPQCFGGNSFRLHIYSCPRSGTHRAEHQPRLRAGTHEIAATAR